LSAGVLGAFLVVGGLVGAVVGQEPRQKSVGWTLTEYVAYACGSNTSLPVVPNNTTKITRTVQNLFNDISSSSLYYKRLFV
jgi:hypothetical protein